MYIICTILWHSCTITGSYWYKVSRKWFMYAVSHWHLAENRHIRINITFSYLYPEYQAEWFITTNIRDQEHRAICAPFLLFSSDLRNEVYFSMCLKETVASWLVCFYYLSQIKQICVRCNSACISIILESRFIKYIDHVYQTQGLSTNKCMVLQTHCHTQVCLSDVDPLHWPGPHN